MKYQFAVINERNEMVESFPIWDQAVETAELLGLTQVLDIESFTMYNITA